MQSPEELIHNYYALNPTHFSEVAKLEIEQTFVGKMSEIELRLELYPLDTKSRCHLHFHFSGVRELQYHPCGAVSLHIGLLMIVSIAEYGWEGINYKVFESEQDTTFSFYCREFRAWIQ